MGWATAKVLALNGHLVTSLSHASIDLLHGWNSNDWSMPLAKGFFLSKSEAQTFKNPVLKYLLQGLPKAGNSVREQDSQGNCSTLLRSHCLSCDLNQGLTATPDMKYASALLLGHNNDLNDFFLTAAGTGEEMMMLGCFLPTLQPTLVQLGSRCWGCPPGTWSSCPSSVSKSGGVQRRTRTHSWQH